MNASKASSLSIEQAAGLVHSLRDNVQKAVFGQEELIEEALCCLLAGGHILMTGAPGLAKTTLVRVISQHLGLHYSRIQFTPDLLPSDIIGAELLSIDPQSGKRVFEFAKGPVFTNFLLADEINRASPRTQSALLEAMQERACTVAGEHHLLGNPFMVFATQNPFESEGTFPLPEAQLDRFLLHSLVDYPSQEAEERILAEHAENRLIGEMVASDKSSSKAIDHQTVLELINCCRRVPISKELTAAINQLVRSTRPGDETCPAKYRPYLWYGAGPRAGLALISVCRSLALLSGDEAMRWSHIVRLAKPALRHRLRLSAQALRDGFSEDGIIDDLVHNMEEVQRNRGLGIR